MNDYGAIVIICYYHYCYHYHYTNENHQPPQNGGKKTREKTPKKIAALTILVNAVADFSADCLTTEAPGEYPEEGPAPEAFADHGGSKLPMGIPDSSHSSHSWYLNFLLVGALDHELNFSHHIGNVIIPTDFHIFQRGRHTTNQFDNPVKERYPVPSDQLIPGYSPLPVAETETRCAPVGVQRITGESIQKADSVFFLTFQAWLASGAKGLTHCFDRLLPWTFQEVGFLEILYFPGLQIVLGQNVKTYGFPFGMNISDYQLLKKATSHLPAIGDLTTSHMPIATFNLVKWLNWIQLFWWTNQGHPVQTGWLFVDFSMRSWWCVWLSVPNLMVSWVWMQLTSTTRPGKHTKSYIENAHRNSGFTHEKSMVMFQFAM